VRTIRVFLLLLFITCGAAAQAQVEISFYSKDMASSFPHAYIRLTGTNDRTGQPIDVNYGFTPVSLGPGILFGSVRGMIESAGPEYIARSDRHFSLALTNEQYAQVVAIVDKWRDAPQPSYRLNGRNCVDFVADVATALGLQAPVIPKLMKKPKSYLDRITELNSDLIAHWSAHPATLAGTSQSPPVQAVPAH
jgi:hypothetical protein